ncbi:MAG TPA: hydantoinase/oxoprolinase family protein [Geminicoccaceae bacterium]
MAESAPARLAVDIGGTFTDLVVEQAGHRHTLKLLTTPDAPEEAVLDGVRALLERVGLHPRQLGVVIHGTTLATNAVIERRGARTALITTRGFRDVLAIGDEGRFDQYDINLVKTEPLVPRHLRFPVGERITASGEVLTPLDEAAVRDLLPDLDRLEVESVAIGFLHSYANPAHERRAADLIQGARPDLRVTLSGEVCPEIREYERFTTAVVNAYVQPRIAGYLRRLEQGLADLGLAAPLFMITSGGGLIGVEHAAREPVRLIESGPAGGAILAARIAEEAGLERVLSFDMGGTTAKICLIDDFRPETSRTFEVDRQARFVKGSGLPIRIPVIEMVEIGAGGGSIARLDATRRIAVGPESAGAEPGPACYDRGGRRPTVTDADLLLGRLAPDGFAGGRMTLRPDLAAAAVREAVGRPLGMATELAAFGISEMVEETMANAARVHAVERGRTLGARTLIAFGGAAPVHAARLAAKLGIRRILVPAGAGVGSAVGFLRAPAAYATVRSRYMRLGDFDPGTINRLFDDMLEEARTVVEAAAPGAPLEDVRSAHMRYVGQGHEVVADLPARRLASGDARTMREAFEQAYGTLYGRLIPNLDVEILSFGLELRGPVAPVEHRAPSPAAPAPPLAGRRRLFDAERRAMIEVEVYARDDLVPGARVDGPAVLVEDDTTIVVPAGFEAQVDGHGHVQLERHELEIP